MQRFIIPWILLLLPCSIGGMSSIQLKLTPLIGGPSFFPIHVKVIVAEDHIYDFVPIDARNPQVTSALLQGKHVSGEIRRMGDKKCNSHLVEIAERFADDYDDTQLHIISNNCWTFALRLLWELQTQQRKGNLG
jgi:hypothetical protein